MCWKDCRLCTKRLIDKMNFWVFMAYPMLYLSELDNIWCRFRVIRSFVAQDMNDTVGDVQAARQLDLRTLKKFYRVLYLFFGHEIL